MMSKARHESRKRPHANTWVQWAVERLHCATIRKVFVWASARCSSDGKHVDRNMVREAYERYVKHGTLMEWVRRRLYKLHHNLLPEEALRAA